MGVDRDGQIGGLHQARTAQAEGVVDAVGLSQIQVERRVHGPADHACAALGTGKFARPAAVPADLVQASVDHAVAVRYVLQQDRYGGAALAVQGVDEAGELAAGLGIERRRRMRSTMASSAGAPPTQELVRHACDPLRLRLRRTRHELHVEVCDGSPILAQAKPAGSDEESGRGLTLLDQLAAPWGTLPTQEGKAAWF
ncbi:hypothetical protein [Streptomyces alboniger]|nr:hypothetical protein [Streptomyces alboniger]